MPIGREVDRRKKNSYPGGGGENVVAMYCVMSCGDIISDSYPLCHSLSLASGSVCALRILPVKNCLSQESFGNVCRRSMIDCIFWR